MAISNKYARDYNSLFIAKLDPLGKGIWVQQVGGGSTYDLASIQTDAQGNIYLVACMARFANFGETNLSGYEDILVAKYDADGHLAWAKKAGGNGYDYGQSLAVTPDGFAYVTGIFEKSAPFDHLTLTSRGGNDLFLDWTQPRQRPRHPNRLSFSLRQVSVLPEGRRSNGRSKLPGQRSLPIGGEKTGWLWAITAVFLGPLPLVSILIPSKPMTLAITPSS